MHTLEQWPPLYYLLEILLPFIKHCFLSNGHFHDKEQGLDKGVVFSVAPLNNANEIPSLVRRVFTKLGINLDSVYRDENCLCRVPNCATEEGFLGMMLKRIYSKKIKT